MAAAPLVPKSTSLEELEGSIGYSFRDRGLLERALTHSSSANEAAQVASDTYWGDNERLEFLGDSILGFCVSEWLFARFPEYSEGRLSTLKNHLVSASHLLDAAHRLELGQHLRLGHGEDAAGGRQKQRLLVNAFEAILAAVYLDGGISESRGLVERLVIPSESSLAELAGAGPPHDFRAELDRLARDRALPRPEYRLIEETGPGHARVFAVEVKVGQSLNCRGTGASKKAASHDAAKQACEIVRAEFQNN